MSFTSLINLRHCRVMRKTDVLLEKTTITVNPVVTRQPPAKRPGCMEVYISGCFAGTGNVTIFGTDAAGLGINETLTFTANGIETGWSEFQTITSIVTLGFVGEPIVGDITIKLVTPSGAPIYQEIEIFPAMPAWIDMRKGGVVVQVPGGVITSVTKLFCKLNPLQPVLENDIIYYRDRKYRIDAVEEVMSRSATPHHLELILKQAKTNED